MGIIEILMRQEREEAFRQGFQEGFQEALMEILHKERKKNVFNLRKNKFSVKIIAEILNLPLSDIKAFFKELDDEKHNEA